MSIKIKNISKSEVLTLKEQISYQEGQVVSKTLAQNPAVSITLFSFAKGEEISTHESGGDAFVTCAVIKSATLLTLIRKEEIYAPWRCMSHFLI